MVSRMVSKTQMIFHISEEEKNNINNSTNIFKAITSNVQGTIIEIYLKA